LLALGLFDQVDDNRAMISSNKYNTELQIRKGYKTMNNQLKSRSIQQVDNLQYLKQLFRKLLTIGFAGKFPLRSKWNLTNGHHSLTHFEGITNIKQITTYKINKWDKEWQSR
jgi:hypothetical protein